MIVHTDIWIPRLGDDYVINMSEPFFADVRRIYSMYGNTAEGRKFLKKIKNERDVKIKWVKDSPIAWIKRIVENNIGITEERVAESVEWYIEKNLKDVNHYCLPLEEYTCRINYFIEKYGK